MDDYTRELIDELFAETPTPSTPPDPETRTQIEKMAADAESATTTGSILDLFSLLKRLRQEDGQTPEVFGLSRERLADLSQQHEDLDEHHVTVGGRLNRARPIVEAANARVDEYLRDRKTEAPSGIELWEVILQNQERIQSQLNMGNDDWSSYSGQLKNCIDSVDTLAEIVDLSPEVIADVTRVTRRYRMRMTPYYASLIRPGIVNDPVLLQSVPTAEMVDNVGVEIPPVAADHSPARLIDQFYPRTVTIKVTNMCAMYCTHCLRIAHIGKKDTIYPEAAYGEALEYIRQNDRIRDVLITGGDAFVLPNRMIRKILDALDGIDHVHMKRLGTRIPVTAPMRVDDELLDILEASNDRKPVRVVTQINTAQEITPVSRTAFKEISKRVSAVLNQAVLLKGINDTRVKMWKLCETIQESYVRPYYIFNCSYRNPQFMHFRVPVETGRDIVESMYGNLSGDAIPRYIATAGGKIPLHRSNVLEQRGDTVILRKPWSGETVEYPDPDPADYARDDFSFNRYN